MFADLDNALSKDAMNRLRSSPQGSILGTLNALFSPHPVAGAPSPSQAAAQGLLGQMVNGPGETVTDTQRNLITDVIGVNDEEARAAGAKAGTEAADAAADAARAEAERRDGGLIGSMVGDATDSKVTTEDVVKDVVKVDDTKARAEGAKAGRDAADAASDAAKAEADKNGSGWLSGLVSGASGLLGGLLGGKGGKGGEGGKKKEGGDGDGSVLDEGLLGGIGPSILGIPAMVATKWIAGIGTALAALPSLLGVIGTAGGAALVGGLLAAVVATSPKLKAQFSAIGTDAENVLKAAAGPVIPAISAVLGQIPGLVKGLEPQLAGIFAAVAPQLEGTFTGLIPIITGLMGLMKAAAPAFGPFVEAIENLVSSLFPGLIMITKATVPVIGQFGQIMGNLGKDLGALFGDMAPAVKASMTVLGALFGLIGGLLPVIAHLADIFAQTLAPVIAQFAGAIKALTPAFTAIGKIVGDLAGAILGDLASAFGALAQLLAGIAPGLNAFAKAIGSVFTVLENTGTFAILGDAIEDLVGPLSAMINALLDGLVPILPPLIGFIGQLSGLIATTLAGAVATLLPPLTSLAVTVLGALAQILPPVLGLLEKLAGIFTGAVVGAVAALASGLAGILNALPPGVIAAMVLGIAAVVGGLKLWAAAEAAVAGMGIADVIGAFTEATEGLTIADKALVAAELAVEAVNPLAWAAAGIGAVAALAFGIAKLAQALTSTVSPVAGTVSALQQQYAALGYTSAGWAAFGQKAAAGAQQAAQAGGLVNSVVSQALSRAAAAADQAAGDMDSRVAALSQALGVSGTVIAQWASAAGISAAKFGSSSENVTSLTAAIAAYVNKNPQAVTASASLATNIAIFGGDVFDATAQLDAFNAILDQLVGGPLAKQEAITGTDTAFANLAGTIKTGGLNATTTMQSYESYISQILSSASTLEQNGASVATINNYLQTQISRLKSLGPLNASERADLANLVQAQTDLANSTHGLTGAQLTLIQQAEGSIIPDLLRMHADTPLVTTDVSDLADAITQTGTQSAATAADRAALIRDLEAAGNSAQASTAFVNQLTTALDRIPRDVNSAINIAANITGTSAATLQFLLGAQGYASGGILTEPVIGYGVNTGQMYTLAENGPEMVTPMSQIPSGGGRGGGAGDSTGQIHADLQQLITVARQIPAATGQHVGGAINGAASQASFRSRYPRGGS